AIGNATALVESDGNLPTGPFLMKADTNGSGEVVVALLSGTYNLSASASGYSNGTYPTPIRLGPSERFNATLTLNSISNADIHFFVVNGTHGVPLGGAQVSLPGAGSGTTNVEGWWNDSDIVPGTYQVTGSAAGYFTNQTPATFVAGEYNARYVIRLFPAPPANMTVPTLSGGEGLAFFQGSGLPLWALLLVPLVAAVASVVYLLILRVPSTPRRPTVAKSPPVPPPPDGS
ncbi:MAG: carboxypeptidase-like regulatory domain-containing protein, partial [Thermoplasmata archaeon]